MCINIRFSTVESQHSDTHLIRPVLLAKGAHTQPRVSHTRYIAQTRTRTGDTPPTTDGDTGKNMQTHNLSGGPAACLLTVRLLLAAALGFPTYVSEFRPPEFSTSDFSLEAPVACRSGLLLDSYYPYSTAPPRNTKTWQRGRS